MKEGREAGGDGDGATYALSKTDRRALRQISRGGRAGATARQIGYRRMEAAGLATGLRLLRKGLVMLTLDNRFVLAKYADDTPLPRPKPAPIDVTGMKITKLPPGEARGARDLQNWHSSK
jgi:hypothetical protein